MLPKEKIKKYFESHPEEKKVLQMLHEGIYVKRIADLRHVAVSTVRHQIEHIHKILDTHDLRETILRAMDCGLLP